MRQWSRHSLRRGWGRIHLLSLLHDSSTLHHGRGRTDSGGRTYRPHSLSIHRSTPNGRRRRTNGIRRSSGGLLVSPKRYKILFLPQISYSTWFTVYLNVLRPIPLRGAKPDPRGGVRQPWGYFTPTERCAKRSTTRRMAGLTIFLSIKTPKFQSPFYMATAGAPKFCRIWGIPKRKPAGSGDLAAKTAKRGFSHWTDGLPPPAVDGRRRGRRMSALSDERTNDRRQRRRVPPIKGSSFSINFWVFTNERHSPTKQHLLKVLFCRGFIKESAD